ncbi:MAG: hypothetical protein AB1918_06460 [Pseudomonadota bacterium]
MLKSHDASAIDAAMRMGAEAARDGKTEKANPYQLDDSVRFGAWLAGWISGNRPPTRQ